ncbi:PKD domain protein [Pigmentiphaga humi]|uniref:PKD domain protein n=1 Tax=Pigmentiphaga humi TaxID=2478468 RepID=A0A3P4AYF9_9BURK|nr:PKD domain-containing protein [Pigmentiphaga humi]VCU68458.1 PKD domain protein [Pigmentiphaga humi]
MRFLLRNLFMGLGTTLLLAACGGGGDGGDRVSTAPPTVTISPDRATVEVGAAVTARGEAQSSSGGAFTYRWSLDKPADSAAALDSASRSTATFTPDLAGEYRLSLTVNDGKADSTAALAVFTASSTDPVANAGTDITTVAATVGLYDQLTGGTVQLNGTRSQPPTNGDLAGLSYQWSLAQVPESSKAALDDATLAEPRFTADKEGTYRATLVVRYGNRISKSDEVVINVVKSNVPPVAVVKFGGEEVKDAITVVRGQTVTLDASGSADPDSPGNNSHLQYRWEFANGASPGVPNGSKSVLSGATTAVASFTPDMAISYRYAITLYIYDGVARTTKSFYVHVTKPEGAANTPPTMVSPLPPYTNATYEIERGAKANFMSDKAGYDIDGDSLKYQWKWISYPSGFDPETGSTFTTSYFSSVFTPNVDGEYVIEVQASDGQALGASVRQTYTVRLGANRAPAASAGLAARNTTVAAGSIVTLDGSGSSDPDGNRLDYAWTLLDRPDGSTAVLNGATTVRPTLTADKPGYYTAALTVKDSHGFPGTNVAKVTFKAKSTNYAPVVRLDVPVNYTSEQPMVIGYRGDKFSYTNSLTKHTDEFENWLSFSAGVNAVDPEDDPLTVLGTLVQEPTGNAFRYPATGNLCNNGLNVNDAGMASSGTTYTDHINKLLAFRDWECPSVTLAPSVPGDYRLEFFVSDGTDRVGPYAVTVPTAKRENYPSLLLEDLKKSHDWSNNEQKIVIRQTNPADTPQVTFPTFGLPQANRRPVLPFSLYATLEPRIDEYLGTDLVLATYRLTAYGGDYTITGLQASDSTGVEKPRFVGLSNNQVIKRGQSVEFQLVWPVSQTMQSTSATLVERFSSLSWAFKIAERPAWTFDYSAAAVR